jgi:hypothetical protein
MYLGFKGYKVKVIALKQLDSYFLNLGYQRKNKVMFEGIQHSTTQTNEWHTDRYFWSKKSYVVVIPTKIPFTKQTTTQLVAGSHWFPFLYRWLPICREEVPLESVLIFDAGIKHRRPFFTGNRPSISLLYEKI